MVELINEGRGQNCIDPRAMEDRPRRFRVGILRLKNSDPEETRCGVNFPSGGMPEFVLAVTAASMPIVTLGSNGQGRTYLTGRAPSPRSFARADVDASNRRHFAGVVARAKPRVVWRRLAGRIDLPATQRSEADQNSLQPLARK